MTTLLKIKQTVLSATNEHKMIALDNHLKNVKIFAEEILNKNPNVNKLTVSHTKNKSYWKYDVDLGYCIYLNDNCSYRDLQKCFAENPFFEGCKVSLYENHIEITL